MNKQQVFDSALFGIRGQDYKPSRSGGGSCAYFGKDGLRCSIGHSLPAEWEEDFLTSSINSEGVRSLMQDKPEAARLFEDIPCAFLFALQNAHDNCLGKSGLLGDEFERFMSELASREGLAYKDLTT